KNYYTSNALNTGFYTTFYICNNLEAFFLIVYMLCYIDLNNKTKNVIGVVNLSLFSVFVILDIINIFTGIFFTSVNGEHVISKTMMISQGYQVTSLVIAFVTALVNKKLLIREKVAFASYCVLPFAAMILQNIFKGYAIAYLSIVIATEILFFFLNVQRNIQLIEEQRKNKEAHITIMMSQIQPHFIYNSLSSISTLIPLDPKKAQEALDNFTEYLRHDLSSLTQTDLISFDDELRHIETYACLEKIRFGDRLKITYDIKTRNFYVPPLSIQPIVENAIKHGILKKIEGGHIIFKTYETKEAYVVEVIDDGVGFDIENANIDTSKHFGLNNIRYRLKTMCKGTLDMYSEVGKGTKAVITFYKG
ncbi:MAG: histidine kinase, partial [Bacilli bacterium]|nr:histidine kinase [Bacilli bacterium]